MKELVCDFGNWQAWNSQATWHLEIELGVDISGLTLTLQVSRLEAELGFLCCSFEAEFVLFPEICLLSSLT